MTVKWLGNTCKTTGAGCSKTREEITIQKGKSTTRGGGEEKMVQRNRRNKVPFNPEDHY